VKPTFKCVMRVAWMRSYKWRDDFVIHTHTLEADRESHSYVVQIPVPMLQEA
jgi:hypothetical protein